MKKFRVYAISGKFCSGKTTLSQALLDAIPTVAFSTSFADPLKHDIASLVGAAFYEEGNKGVLRPLLQTYGTVMKELYGEYYWAEKLLTGVRAHLASGVSDDADYIIDDVRYRVELEVLRTAPDVDLVIVRLNVSEHTQKFRYISKYGREPKTEELNHHSETDLDEYPYFDHTFLSDDFSPEEMVGLILSGDGE